jgi:pimeloyl-ACP methyl ester carboxylesterase
MNKMKISFLKINNRIKEKKRTFFLLLSLLPILGMAQKQPFNYMESLVYPYPVQKVVLPDGPEIAYIDEGKGPYTLVMVHGLGSYLPVYTKLVEHLKQDYRCIALDLPNYGKSSRGDYPFDMAFFAETVSKFIQALKLKKVVLIGHSMGAQIAMTLALQEPDLAKALVLLAPAGFETFTPENKAWFSSFMQPQIVKATPVAQIEANFNVNFHGNTLPEDARFMLEDRLKMREDSIEYDHYCRMIPKCVMGMLEQPVYDNLNQIPWPTLIFFGEQDLLIPNRLLHPGSTTRQVAERGQARIPGSQLVMLPNCGHFVPWECADQVADELRSFCFKIK